MIKKLTSLSLLVTFMMMFVSPLSAETVNQEEMSLYEFLKTTDSISASYTYPSMQIATATAGKSVIPAHTPVILRCTNTITTKEVVTGGTVNFAVLNDVRDNSGNILVKAGSPVTAQISFAKDKGMIGKSGELTVTDFHTTAVDGSYVALSGSVSARPDDKMVVSVVLSVLICPLFLLMKGDEARLTEGATKTAYTITDVYVKPVRL